MRIVDRAAALGLYIGLVPTWGDKINRKGPEGAPPLFDEASAEAYGRFLGRRYGGRAHPIWILGGDSRPRSEAAARTWRALARGVALGAVGREDYDAVLMTYHPPGGTFRPPATSSGEFFHHEPWLAFNMIQSGHRLGNRNWERIAEDYARRPTKPTMDAEPCYEDHCPLHRATEPRFTPWHVRQRAYWALCAGAHGHTYGHDTIFQFWEPGRPGVSHPRLPWRAALSAPGGDDMRHVRALFEARPLLDRIPDQALVATTERDETVDPDLDHVGATRAGDGRYALVYLSAGSPVAIDLERLSGTRLVAHWYDPREGTLQRIGAVPRRGKRRFVPPSGGIDQDWVLVLEDAARARTPA